MIYLNNLEMKGGSTGVIILVIVIGLILGIGLVVYLFMFGPLKNIMTNIFSNLKCINNSEEETILNNSYNWLTETSSGPDRVNTFLFKNNKGNKLNPTLTELTNEVIKQFELNDVRNYLKTLDKDPTGLLKKNFLKTLAKWINDNTNSDGKLIYKKNAVDGQFSIIITESQIACKNK